MPRFTTMCLLVFVVSLNVSSAQASESPYPDPLIKLKRCQELTDAKKRLACLDNETTALISAQKVGKIIVENAAKFDLTGKPSFGRRTEVFNKRPKVDTHEEITSLETTIQQVRLVGRGLWEFDLADGGTWTQIQPAITVKDPKVGMPVQLRKGSLGSYLVNVDGQRAIKMRRTD